MAYYIFNIQTLLAVFSVQYCLHVQCFILLQGGIDRFYDITPDNVFKKGKLFPKKGHDLLVYRWHFYTY